MFDVANHKGSGESTTTAPSHRRPSRPAPGLYSLDLSVARPGAATVQRKCSCGGQGGPGPGSEEKRRRELQMKLTVGAPHDAYELEADHVAGQVMRMPAPHAPRRLDRSSASNLSPAPTLMIRRISRLKTPVQ